MPIEFWSDEPEDNRSIEEIIKKFSEFVPKTASDEIPVIREFCPIGTRVKPGKDWGVWKDDGYKLSDKDSRYSSKYKIGTIDAHYTSITPDWVHVIWDTGETDWYRAGPELGTAFNATTGKMVEAYDLYVYEEPLVEEILVTETNRKIGMKVKPSSQFGNFIQANGKSARDENWYQKEYIGTGIGTITEFYGVGGFEDYVYVRWIGGGGQYYRTGSRTSGSTLNRPQYDLAIAEETT